MQILENLFIVAILCAIAVVKTEDKQACETENLDDGVCVKLQNCYYFKEINRTVGASPEQRAVIQSERQKCTNNSSGEDLVCCKRKPPAILSWTFEDSKPLTNNSNFLPNVEICGKYETSNIFHGNVTELGQYPWLVLIKYIRDGEETFDCGGSLISKRYVVTAAHCITSNIFEIRLGEWDLETDPDCVQKAEGIYCALPVVDVGIAKIQIHKNFTRRQSQGGNIDLALIKLNQDAAFTVFVQPICLPTTEAIKSYLYVSGWGVTEHYTPSTKKLFTIVYHVEKDQCIKQLNTDFIKIDDTVICANGKHGEDSCSGDSGGPLMQIGSAKIGSVGAPRLFLAGVVSSGLACGSTKPAFYTNVFKQLNWIISNMEQ